MRIRSVGPVRRAFPAFCGTAALCLAASAASPPDLPSASEVLERHIVAIGGRQAVMRHSSMTMKGRYQVPAQKVDLETLTYARDGKFVLRADLPGGAVFRTGYDGQTAWTISGAGKVTLPAGDVLKSIARDADLYYHLHVLQYFRSMKVVDVQPFNYRPCYHLLGVNNWGKVNEHFYDTKTGLLQGYAFDTAWRGGKGAATDTFEDYREFGGIQMAAKTTSRDGDDITITLITSVSYDDVDDSVFALPQEVRDALPATKSP